MLSESSFPILCHSPRVSIIGAGRVGSTLAQRIVEKNLADVVLLDIIPKMPQGIALDLMEARALENHTRRIIGTNDYADIFGSEIVVIAAGFPRKPGMSRDDLLQKNAEIVIEAATNAIAHSPQAIFIVVTNPLDVMTYLVWQAIGLSRDRIMGMAGVLDSARFETYIAMELGISPLDVSAMVLGSHGDSMLPLPRYSTVNGIPITELMNAETIERLVNRTCRGGAEIVDSIQTGGAFFAPASATCAMIETILRNHSRMLPVSALMQGEYGLNDLFVGVPCRLGCGGIEKVIELNLTDVELDSLRISATSVRQNIDKVKDVLKIK
ncbi:malate dehydrogenase, NAD-dependent [Calothrix sp. NIES-4071]|nr:malate dehydrogenase, NAD-dependent [Calothrix sp. NIES-4071]BAZ60661.1 malate dehydrogenase, NAD-dependent [Calothrix sp. NIES-4105]